MATGPESSSPVRVDPNVRFGRATIGGISTHAIWEQLESGEDVPAVAEIFGLEPKQFRSAYAYENAVQAA